MKVRIKCPSCKGYFKIKLGTGLPGSTLYHCPYCNHIALYDQFWTKDQLNFAKSVALNYTAKELLKSLKKLEIKPKQNQLISLSIKVKGKPTPIAYYSERELEQSVCCKNCTFEYAIFKNFGYCPDSGIHNSHDIFITNIELFKKLLLLSQNSELKIYLFLYHNFNNIAYMNFLLYTIFNFCYLY